jgi:hypothetical protein
MKNNYTYKEFMDKCMMIYKNNKIENVVIENQVIGEDIENEIVENVVIENGEVENIVIENQVVQEKRTIVKSNKLSSDQMKERNRIKKQRQRERLIAKYGNEEYKKMRAKEIAENRRKNG